MLLQRTILRLKGRDTLWIESSLLLKHQVENNVYHLMGQRRHYLNTKILVRFIDSLRLLCFDCLYNDSSHNFRVFCILCFTFLNLSNFLQYAFVVCFFSDGVENSAGGVYLLCPKCTRANCNNSNAYIFQHSSEIIRVTLYRMLTDSAECILWHYLVSSIFTEEVN